MRLSEKLAKYGRDWRTLPADARVAYRKEGWGGVRYVLALRTVYRVMRTGHLVVFAHPLEDSPEVVLPPGVTIAQATEADWPRLSGLMTGRELERFRSLVSAGRHCVVAWRGSVPIGYAWVAEDLGPDVTLCPIPMPADAAYLWDLYVLPWERCNGIGTALAAARVRLARERGFREGWRMIAPSNQASLRTLQKTSKRTRVVGELRYLKLLSRMHVRFTPA